MPDNSEQIPIEEKRKLLFVQLLTSFQQAAWTGLGKIQGPDGKIAVDLDAASAYIDLLDMLRDLTQGNLEEELAKLLERMVGDLKLNYLEESADKKTAEEGAAEATTEAVDSETDAPAEEAAAEDKTTGE
jgi:hypothetical protein